MPAKKILALLICFFLSQSAALAAYDFPYLNITLKSPALEDPYPGMGNNYSSLGRGIDTVLWNPAGLARMNTTEVYIGLPSAPATPRFTRSFNYSDFGIDTGQMVADLTETASSAGFTAGVMFTHDLTQTKFSTHEYTGHLIYATIPTGSVYKQSMRSDWMSFGVSTHGESGYSFALAGSFPAQLKLGLDMYNSPNMGDGFSINNGVITITYTPESGPGYSYTTPAPIWNGFLIQDQRLPVSTLINLRDELNVKSDLTLTGAGKFGNLYLGANITPIFATYNLDNSVKVVVNKETSDLFVYMPNFDIEDEVSVVDWFNDPNKYSTPAGYNKNISIKVPSGSTLAEFRYQGFYNASAARIDLGAMYEVDDNLTLGLALENVNKAELNFKVVGATSYANYRAILDEGTDTDIPSNYTLYTARPLLIEPEKNVPIPQRLRIGLTLQRPFLISLDYEWLLTAFHNRYNYVGDTYTDLIFRDVRMIRAGIEAQVFSYPLFLRSGAIILLTPELLNADRDTQITFNKMFAYGFYPLKIDIGARLAMETYELGVSGGFSGVPLFSPFSVWWLSTPALLDYGNRDVVTGVAVLFPTIISSYNMGDTLNQDVNRILYYSGYIKRDNWQVTFQNAFDFGATGRAYNTAANRRDVFSWIKWLTTLTVSLKF